MDAIVQVFQNSPAVFYLSIGVIALMVGSFLNVVIIRLPKMIYRDWREQCEALFEVKIKVEEKDKLPERYNLIVPGSHCPTCNHAIRWYDNIPLLSFLFLKGQCRYCQANIHWCYPLVEIFTVILSLIVAIQFGPTYQTAFALLFTWSLLSLALIDYHRQLLLDDITLPLLWLGLLVNSFGLFCTLQSAVIGAIAGYLTLWIPKRAPTKEDNKITTGNCIQPNQAPKAASNLKSP